MTSIVLAAIAAALRLPAALGLTAQPPSISDVLPVRPTTIGVVRSPARDAVLPLSATSPAEVGASAARAAGALRIGDALVALPGVSAVGQGSSVSDDLYLSLRGFKPSESLTLLDGHPIGPLGVSPDAMGAFDYQNAPLFALQRATVMFGAGPADGAAYDALAGSVELQTLAPTTTPVLDLAQAGGSQGRASSFAAATGAAGALRYAFAAGVQGTSGNFSPQTITQTGLRGTDFTRATLHALTYPVSANSLLRNALGSVQIPLGRATSIALTAYDATSWADKTGVDDNDDYPYAFELYQANQNVGGSLTAGGAHCAATRVPVIDDAHPDPARPDCITPAAFAAGASGPAGGGPGAYQTMREADEAMRVMTSAGTQTIVFDGFVDAETTDLVRPASFVQGDADATSTHIKTTGFAAHDLFAIGSTTIDAGVSSLQQIAQTTRLGEENAFVDTHVALARRLDIDANLLVKHLDAFGQSAIDPRLTFSYRPTSRDAFRLRLGAASEEPAATARGGTTTLTSAGDLDPGNCSTFTIGSAPNARVTSERGSDAELAFGHHVGRVDLSASAYVTSVRGQIFGAGAPLGTLLGFSVTSPGLAAFYDRVRSICPGAYAGATDTQIFNALAVTEPINAARALTRGVELRGATPLGRALTIAFTYTIDSARRFDLPASVLALPANWTIVDGGQVAGVPVHQASLTLAHVSDHGITATLSAFYVGPNNNLNLPGYADADVSVGSPIGRGRRLDVAVNNAFDSHADTYGRVGLGLFQPENPFGTDGSALAQATERYGLAPTRITLTITQRVGPSSP